MCPFLLKSDSQTKNSKCFPFSRFLSLSLLAVCQLRVFSLLRGIITNNNCAVDDTLQIHLQCHLLSLAFSLEKITHCRTSLLTSEFSLCVRVHFPCDAFKRYKNTQPFPINIKCIGGDCGEKSEPDRERAKSSTYSLLQMISGTRRKDHKLYTIFKRKQFNYSFLYLSHADFFLCTIHFRTRGESEF